MKALFQNAKQWAIANPKSFYKYAMGGLILSFVINMIFSILSYNENKIELINEELKGFKIKRDNGNLSTADSLRIEFLYEQYKALTNGKEN